MQQGGGKMQMFKSCSEKEGIIHWHANLFLLLSWGMGTAFFTLLQCVSSFGKILCTRTCRLLHEWCRLLYKVCMPCVYVWVASRLCASVSNNIIIYCDPRIKADALHCWSVFIDDRRLFSPLSSCKLCLLWWAQLHPLKQFESKCLEFCVLHRHDHVTTFCQIVGYLLRGVKLLSSRFWDSTCHLSRIFLQCVRKVLQGSFMANTEFTLVYRKMVCWASL